MAEPMPRGGSSAGLLEQPRPDRGDNPGLFQYGHERLWVDDASHGMPPAQERLHAAHVDAVKFEYRLIENEELVLLEGLPEIGLELEPLHPGGLHLGLEPDVTIPSPGLRLTEGDGCVAEEIVRLVPVICRDADTRRDRKRNVNEPFDSEWFLQGVQQPFGEQFRPCRKR